MNQSLILDLLENNARLSSQDLADILNEDEASIKSEIQSLEKNKILNQNLESFSMLKIIFSQLFSYFLYFSKPMIHTRLSYLRF